MDLYKILGIEKFCTPEEIKKAYRELSKVHHPDVGGDEKVFIEINTAYKILSNKEKREMYDTTGYITPDEMFLKQQCTTRIVGMAEEYLIQLIKSGGNVRMSILRFFNESVRVNRENLENKADELDRVEEVLNSFSERLSHSEQAKTVIHNTIEQKISLVNADKLKIKDENAILDLIAIEIEKYAYDEPNEIMEATTSTTTVTGVW